MVSGRQVFAKKVGEDEDEDEDEGEDGEQLIGSSSSKPLLVVKYSDVGKDGSAKAKEMAKHLDKLQQVGELLRALQ